MRTHDPDAQARSAPRVGGADSTFFFGRLRIQVILVGLCVAAACLLGRGVQANTFETTDPVEIANIALETEDRTALAEHAASVYQQQRAADTLDLPAWVGAMELLGRDVPEATRILMRQDVLAHFASDDPSIVGLDRQVVVGVGAALVNLGDRPEAGRVAATWVTSSESYLQADAAQMRRLAWLTQQAGEAGRDAQRRIITRLIDTDLANPVIARQAGSEYWYKLVEFLRRSPTPEQRAALATGLRQAFLSDESAIRELSASSLYQTTQALWWLFDRNDMPLETWLFGPALVDAEADPATLNWLAWRLIKAPRAAHHDEDREQALNTARLRLSEHIEQRFIVSDEALRTVSLGALPTYFAAVSDVLDGQQREAWSQRVQQAWASSDEAVGALSAGQLDGIRRALASVDRPASHELTLRWLKHCPALADVSAGELAVLTRRALSAASLDAAQRMALAEALEALMKANLDEAAPLDFEANIAVLRMWRAVDNREKAIEWTLRSVDRLVGTAEARQQANVRQLELAADYLVTYGLYGEEHPHDALAMAVAHQAAEGKLDVRQPDVIARATSAPGSHQIVEAALSDPQGHPRPGVAEVLAWGARYAGTLEAWKKQLDERVDQEGLGGDGRALWLLARGYASAVGQVRFAPLAGETFYAQAMAEADTEAVRLLAVERLIDGRAWDGEFERAMQLIDSVTGQFTDESIVQKLADRKQRLQVALNRASNRAELSMQQAATHTDPAWRAEIERRLQRAIDRNDQQRIRRYQRQLGVLDHQP